MIDIQDDHCALARTALPEGAALRRLQTFGPVARGGWRLSVALPARDEAERIGGCLDAADTALRRLPLPPGAAGIALLINNGCDATAEIAATWAARHATPLLLAEIDLPGALATAGMARRVALDLASVATCEDGVLATSDADSRVAPDWATEILAAVAEGHDLVCGSIRRDPLDRIGLADPLRDRWDLEARYLDRQLELDARLDTAQGHGGRAFGASLGISAAAYRAIGGMPTPAIGEDRALLARMKAEDRPVCMRAAAAVYTSWRRTGRSGAGLAEALGVRANTADYLCDEMLEPAADAIRRADTRATLRRAWQAGDGAAPVLQALGLPARNAGALYASEAFGAAWQRIERDSPKLRRTPLRAGALTRELPRLERYLAALREDAVREAA